MATVLSVTAEVLARIDPTPEGQPLRDGWRGIIDFGEVWSEAESDLWPPGSGAVPVGQPLVYGCELADADADLVRVRFIALDSLRPVMQPGTRFTLRDGDTPRATGHLS